MGHRHRQTGRPTPDRARRPHGGPHGHRKTEQPISAAAISPDGQHMWSPRSKGCELHDVATGQPIGDPWITDPTVSKRLAASRSAPTGHMSSPPTQRTSQLQLWEVKTGRPIGNPLSGHTGGPVSSTFTADANHIVSRAGDGWMLWPAPTSGGTSSARNSPRT